MGSSINTNTAAMTALATLNQTQKSMEMTQARISSGFRVSTAQDNAAYWSIATTMRSDDKALGAVQDSLGLGAATIDVAYTAMNATVKVVDDIKAKLVAARTPGVDRGKIQSDITELQKQLKNTANSAVFNGENWLSVDGGAASFNPTKTVVASFSRTGGQIAIGTVDVNLNASKLLDSQTETALASMRNTTASVTAGGGFVVQAGGGSLAVNVGGTTTTLRFDQGASLGDVATALSGISGITAQVDSTGVLRIANRNSVAVSFTQTNLSAAPADFTITAIAAPAAPGLLASKKGILDKGYDYYDGAAWTTASVTTVDISKLTDSAADLSRLEVFIRAVDKGLGAITTAATNLGSLKSRIDLQQDFTKALRDSMSRGVGQLVDADMSAESTRLQALQTQQQLGIQALSIANQGAQSILSLFRG
ncbi:flagellin [Salinarimonas soli]|uniref:Flagellin n=1 Tax=Salinarimonas soli TaxID=1638099 RepID=A0A5B2VG67_9HYPH|nr:flagellin [Salinarimonas soli]KAA2237372.1 flagellin [Salinarimonas soli]